MMPGSLRTIVFVASLCLLGETETDSRRYNRQMFRTSCPSYMPMCGCPTFENGCFLCKCMQSGGSSSTVGGSNGSANSNPLGSFHPGQFPGMSSGNFSTLSGGNSSGSNGSYSVGSSSGSPGSGTSGGTSSSYGSTSSSSGSTGSGISSGGAGTIVCPPLPSNCPPFMVKQDPQGCPICSTSGTGGLTNGQLNNCPPVDFTCPTLHTDRNGCLLCGSGSGPNVPSGIPTVPLSNVSGSTSVSTGGFLTVSLSTGSVSAGVSSSGIPTVPSTTGSVSTGVSSSGVPTVPSTTGSVSAGVSSSGVPTVPSTTGSVSTGVSSSGFPGGYTSGSPSGSPAVLTCLTGTDVAIPRAITYVQKCGPHEVCYLDAFASANGIIKYSMGCRDRQFCTGSTGKRAAGNTKFCETCCTTDLCNSAGCGATGYVPRASRGPICYHCIQQRTPESCDKITVCGKDSVCKVKLQPTTMTGDVYYASYCENKLACEHDVAYHLLIVGRKRYSHTVLAPNKTCVEQCCDSDLCSGTCGTNHAQPNIGRVPTGGCPVSWIRHSSSCYLIDAHRRGSWNSANTVCQQFGGYLAEINSAAENAYLLNASTGTQGGDWWIGGNDKASEGDWRWSHSNSLLPVHSPNWGRYRPDNIISSSGEDEDCLEFAEYFQAWNDAHCSDGSNHYICERQAR